MKPQKNTSRTHTSLVNNMRRLPVYLVVDTSGSMSGEPIEAVKNGIHSLLTSLRHDPYALETVHISVITFDSDARQLAPLTEIMQFQAPDFMASGSTQLGAALRLLSERIEREVERGSAERKGDWKPLVFIMTDGIPTDDWRPECGRFKTIKTGIVVACAAGPNADTAVLKEITENVVQLDTADTKTIEAFFKWVSSSVSVGSQKVDGGGEITKLSELPPAPPEMNVVV
ncbi:vWA domain-containing protein [Rhodopseudomonas palustris]|uniref:vWA domain-containing protein n=1 Tax=Rhodopseudomonas palustris TaxID=1076 RepID=UPI000A76C917|nr:VWA domain-containing protein [Rhodopseudomonas palustris]